MRLQQSVAGNVIYIQQTLPANGYRLAASYTCMQMFGHQTVSDLFSWFVNRKDINTSPAKC